MSKCLSWKKSLVEAHRMDVVTSSCVNDWICRLSKSQNNTTGSSVTASVLDLCCTGAVWFSLEMKSTCKIPLTLRNRSVLIWKKSVLVCLCKFKCIKMDSGTSIKTGVALCRHQKEATLDTAELDSQLDRTSIHFRRPHVSLKSTSILHFYISAIQMLTRHNEMFFECSFVNSLLGESIRRASVLGSTLSAFLPPVHLKPHNRAQRETH